MINKSPTKSSQARTLRPSAKKMLSQTGVHTGFELQVNSHLPLRDHIGREISRDPSDSREMTRFCHKGKNSKKAGLQVRIKDKLMLNGSRGGVAD